MKNKLLILAGACLAMVLLLLCAACSSAAQGSDRETTKTSTNTETGVLQEQDSAPVSGPDFDRAKLIETAIENQKNSYAPYSGYNVSAAVLMDSGEIYTGANVENASYPAGVCAEHNAINIAVLNGERRIVAIAIVGGADYTVSDYCAPCGICRQVMREFCDPTKMRVIIAISPTDYKEFTLEELLPESFGPSNLE